MSEKTSVGLYIDQSVLDDIEIEIRKTNCKSRNEFIVEAIRYYTSFLNRQNYSDILTPAYESVIGAKIADTENRLARLLFKLSVEMAMMMNVVAANSEVDAESLNRLRGECVKEVKRLNGNFSFDDAVEWQKE